MQNENQLAIISDSELVNHLENIGLLKDLTAGEKNTYLQIAKAFNLNPFKREIYVSKYNGQMSIITGYETYIKRAERSGMLDGWEVKTEGTVAAVLNESTLKAIITIYRKDRSRPFVWEVKFTEYMQLKDGKLNKFWQKSETMIKKVAMAQGFRLCFNDELGGMPYSSEEVETVDAKYEVVNTTTGEITPAPATTPTPKQKLPAERLAKALTLIEGGNLKIVDQLSAFTINAPQQKLIDAAVLKGEKVASAINALGMAESEKDINDLIATLDIVVVENASFIDAKGKRIEVLMAGV